MQTLSNTENQLSDPQNVQKTSKRAQGPRHPNYWAKRVFLTKVQRGGATYVSTNYYVKIQHAGRRQTFPLGTADKAEAAKLAEEIYYVVHSGPDGWDNAIEKYLKKMVVRSDDPTVGDYLRVLKELSGMPEETFAGYARKLRRVAGAVCANEHVRLAKKYDARKCGRKQWIQIVESVPLRELADEPVRRWQVAYVDGRGGNPIEQKQARHTVDSVIRSCKSLFAPQYTKWAKHLRLPEPIPFRNVEYMTKGMSSYRYRSKIDPIALLEAAKIELRPEDKKPECYKVFLLTLGGGLRRFECDRLRWESVLINEAVIRVEEHEFFRAKSEYSLADVPVEKELIDELLALRRLDDEYVIRSKNKPRNVATYRYYRCEKSFSELCAWLRGKGVNTNNPIHTLRKEYGRLLNEGYGIYAASHGLRHSNVQVTAAFYADDTRRITPSLLGRKTANNGPTSVLNPAGKVVAG